MVLALVAFRIAWGFVGTTHSRFASFWPTRARIKHFFASGWTGVGHNPLGALAVFAMLGATLAQAGSGLFIEDDIGGFRGPLHAPIDADRALWLSAFHAQAAWLMLALIALHVTAIT